MTRCAILLLAAGSAWAQNTRENYRTPYQAWRQAAQTLEQDAAAPPPAFSDQVRSSVEAAQKFFSARAAYLTSAQPNAAEQTAWASQPLATAEALLTTPQALDQLMAVTAAKVSSGIGAFRADDKDEAIRRVLQALERERAALKALTDAMAARKASLPALLDTSDEAEIQRASVFQTLNAANGRRNQLAEHVKREATDWTAYYRDLQEGAGGRAITGAATPAPAKILRTAANGQIPLSRYTGEWMFPGKGLFYGPQPESVEMTVQESNGRMSGTLTAKFLAPGGTVKFDFQGAVQQAKTQSLPLQTADGATGSVELIPGSAINLIEVNFQAAGSAGNFILVKK